MKIAILSFYSGRVNRGVENWTHQLANYLSEKHDVVVYQNGPFSPDCRYRVVTTNLEVDWSSQDTRGTFLRRMFLDYWSRLTAKFLLRITPDLYHERFDVVVPTNGGWQPLMLRIFTWVFGGKLVTVNHSGRGWDERPNLYSFPDVFVALSSTGKAWAKTVNPFVRVAMIPNGIDLSKFSPKGQQVKTTLPKPVVLAVGAPEPGKRLDLAIRAVAQAKMSLLILGKGYNEHDIRLLGEKILGDRFEMLAVDFNTMPMYYRAVDIFTLPSWENEAFGMVYLEAMASGLPVVATNDGLRREIIGDAGLFVDPTDIDSYAAALKRAVSNNWGIKPRRQAEKFSWQRVAKQYEELFTDLIK